ncbi:DUF6634 family protein [Bosea vaviloviae]|uniref:Uncharacterized protein n=1 Tax=Bosea vaviloviae TaxID=1526658 RepID=A0A1D7U4B5_9HYPH|nr:DUF6634 family protein [Bosea vaviloviae]AOO82220.1 hypothetical protein BHK69_18815 [Bosea vaviloviae]
MSTLIEKFRSAQIDLRRLGDGWRPSEADLEDAVGLEDWLPGVDPLNDLPILMGESIGHPILGDQFITTSPVLWLSEDRKIARTLSRWYRLGRCALPVPDEHSPTEPSL